MSSASTESGSGETELALAARPFAYDSGYGDFCFLPLHVAYPQPPKGVVDSDFIRLGTFPLMRLPREIRDQIYNLVLAPLLSKHGSLKDERRELVLRIKKHKDAVYYPLYCQVENLLASVPGHYYNSKNALSPEAREKYEEEKKEVAVLCKRLLHPVRGEYEMTYPNYLSSSDEVRQQIEPNPLVSIASIRNLSNVSCQIRLELGICAWSRSFLEIHHEDYEEALTCLKERPATWKGLKTLHIHINSWPWFSRDLEDLPGRTKRFMPLIEFVDQHLQLDLIICQVHGYKEEINEVLRATVKPSWVKALQGLQCAKAFQSLVSVWDNEMDVESDEEFAAQIQEVEKLLTPVVLRGLAEPVLTQVYDLANHEMFGPGYECWDITDDGMRFYRERLHSEHHFEFEDYREHVYWE